MTDISRAALFGKLNPLAYKAIESATVFCKMRGNPYVELVHWLNQILQVQDSDLHRISASSTWTRRAWPGTSPRPWTDCPAGPAPSRTCPRTWKRRWSGAGPTAP